MTGEDLRQTVRTVQSVRAVWNARARPGPGRTQRCHERAPCCATRCWTPRRRWSLRPVLMTSAATIFGHFPLVLVSGPGAQARNSIGIILVAGMAVGTLFTLFVVPVFYSLIATRHHAEPAHEQIERGPTLRRAAVAQG